MTYDIPDIIHRKWQTQVEFHCDKCELLTIYHMNNNDDLITVECEHCKNKYSFCIPPYNKWMYNRCENYTHTKFCRDNNLFTAEGYESFHNVQLSEEIKRRFFK